MSIKVYINLPVADLKRSRDFFARLGFTFNDQFSDDTALGMTISDDNYAMLLTHEKFASFTPKKNADAKATSEVLVALQLASRADVDRMSGTALAHGGGFVRETQDHGFMYGAAFADPDGHIWEPFWIDPTQMPTKE